MVLLGDSHAAHWAPALDVAAERLHMRLLTYTKSACPAPVFEPFDASLGRAYAECSAWGRKVLREIAELHPRVVVLSLSRGYLDHLTPGAMARWQAGVASASTQLAKVADRVVVMADVPRPGFSVPNCLARAAWRGVDGDRLCSFDTAHEAHETARMWPARALSMGGAAFIETASLVCGTSPCRPMHDGMIRFADTNHLTASFSGSLASSLFEPLRVAIDPASSGGVTVQTGAR